MDQVSKDDVRADEEAEKLASVLARGAILVDAAGNIVWIDESMRRQMNGGLQTLALPLSRSDRPTIDCFLTTAEVVINGQPAEVCVIQQTARHKEPRQFIAAIEAVMADSGWLTRMIVEKFNALSQDAPALARPSDLDILTDREREVLWLICEGRSDAEMGDQLRLSQNTVRNHIASLYRKIGVNRRSAAVIWARERAVTSREALSPRLPKRDRRSHHDGGAE